MASPKRVGLLAPMTHELAPLVEMLDLRPVPDDESGMHVATVGDVEFVAMVTGIGMVAATQVTERLLDAVAVDHVIVVGVAGGLDPSLGIGAVVVPAVVLDGVTGRAYAPDHLGDAAPSGVLHTSDEFIEDDVVLAGLVADGVVALDMETSAVAVVCEARGVPWTVFRSISDRPDDGLVDGAIWGMTRSDGTADPAALERYLASDPGAAARLARLGREMEIATTAAATAAIEACGVAIDAVRRDAS